MTQRCWPHLILFSYPKETKNTQKPKRIFKKKELPLGREFLLPRHINSRRTVVAYRLLAYFFSMVGQEGGNTQKLSQFCRNKELSILEKGHREQAHRSPGRLSIPACGLKGLQPLWLN